MAVPHKTEVCCGRLFRLPAWAFHRSRNHSKIWCNVLLWLIQMNTTRFRWGKLTGCRCGAVPGQLRLSSRGRMAWPLSKVQGNGHSNNQVPVRQQQAEDPVVPASHANRAGLQWPHWVVPDLPVAETGFFCYSYLWWMTPTPGANCGEDRCLPRTNALLFPYQLCIQRNARAW